MTDLSTEPRPINAHAWEREANEHYVEPFWCSERLFAEEKFQGPVWDPCCGFGRIPLAAVGAGLSAVATDVVDRGYRDQVCKINFLKTRGPPGGAESFDIVSNPPFKLMRYFALHALALKGARKVAMIAPTRRLNAARWLEETPLARIWLLTPRPSMPPGHTITAGENPGNGISEFCWLVWTPGRIGPADMRWLRRDQPKECITPASWVLTGRQHGKPTEPEVSPGTASSEVGCVGEGSEAAQPVRGNA